MYTSKGPWRDRFVHWSCNWIINHVAADFYRSGLTVVNRLGREELERRLRTATDASAT